MPSPVQSQVVQSDQIPEIPDPGLWFALLGAGMIVGPLVYLVNMLDVTGAFAAFLASGFNGGLDTAFELVRQRCLLLGWLELPGILFTMAAGAAILYGNIRYARDAWVTLFRRIALME